jgi:Putative auto-transporter adhesin, head GIN domain
MNTSTRQTLISLIAPALLVLALLPAGARAADTKGSGKQVTETRTVAEFQAVATSGSMDLVVRQGAQGVLVQADDNLLPLLETVVENSRHGSTLLVRWKKGERIYNTGKVLVTVTTPKLSAVSNSGSGDIRVETFSTPGLVVSLSGSGDARLDNLTTDELSIAISGSSDVIGKGRAGKVSIAISGSGDVKLADLAADDVTVKIAGSGDAAVNANKTLAVSIAGSGDVSYTGNPSMTTKVAGSGSVQKK